MQSKQIRQYFPKQPYPLQLSIAQTIYQALEKQTKIAIIESPTGTGKTYSLLCPIVAWLSRNKNKISNAQTILNSKLPSWLSRSSVQKGQAILQSKIKAKEQMMNMKDATQIRKSKKKRQNQQKIQLIKEKEITQEQQQIDIDDGNDDCQSINGKKRLCHHNKLIQKQLSLQDKNILPKLIFVSRTHSQLSQIIDSLKLIPQDLNYLQLASKQQLCINKNINENKNNINQKCQYLLDHGNCPHFQQFQIKEFLNKNIDQITQLGKINGLCPYYSTRSIMEHAQILCLPYSSILNRQIRRKLGININNSIIVFDEGHNILDHEKQMYSPSIKIEQIVFLASQIDQYIKKYKAKLKLKNQRLLVHFLQILREFIQILSQQLDKAKKNGSKNYVQLKYVQFLLSLKSIKEINIHKISKYFELNNIDKKISYFNSQQNNQLKIKQTTSKITPTLVNRVLFFLKRFVSFDQFSQVLLLKWNEDPKGSVKIMTLRSQQLQSIIQESRMVIIAGGTMEPIDELISLTQKWKHNMIVKKYPHIIKDDQCKIYIIKNSKEKQIFFNHQTLNHPNSLQYFRPICTYLLEKVMQKTEKGGGIVIFIQNYQLISFYQQIFKGKPYEQNILYDSRSQYQKDTQDIFIKYKKLVESDTINQHILVSVMGGKLSEGINFSDRLARALIVLGLPYSNKFAPEVVQTMSYLDGQNNHSFTGKQYYQNMCIKTLNQTIGRGVRHIHDYVKIYLVDSRFQQIKDKLSNWMKPRITIVQDISSL